MTNECSDLPVFPICPDNRPGLARINRRIGVFSQIREALIYDLNREAVLLNYTHRQPDDPGIALLEGAAIVGDILTFYQDLYANEAYLRTAQWRESVADLVRLLGYRLSPGVGGRATFAVGVRGDAPVTVPAHFPITAEVTGLETPADFETVDQIVAYPWLSSFNLYRPFVVPQVSQSTTELRITSPDPDTTAIEIAEGDRLLIGDPDSFSNPSSLARVEIVVVDGVRQRHGETLYKIKGRLQRATPANEVFAVKIGRSFRHFGAAAPPTHIRIKSDGTAQQKDVYYTRYLTAFTVPDQGTYGDTVVDPSIAPADFPLDARVDDLPLGARVICQIIPPPTDPYFYVLDEGGPQNFVRTITGIRQGSQTWGAMTGSSTVITLNAEISSGRDLFTVGFYGGAGVSAPSKADDYVDIRDLLFHETLSPILRMQAVQEPGTQTSGNSLNFVGSGSQVESMIGQSLMLLRPGDEPRIVTVSAVTTPDTATATRTRLRAITLDQSVTYADFPLEEPVVTVLGNLVAASQGKGEREAVLGNGDNRQQFQTFKLPKAPLTYHVVAAETPPEAPELLVYVNDRLWRRVPSLFGLGPRDEVYIVREDAEGVSWVQFGDGQTGARLPSGVGNVVALYRTGIGAYGALREGTNPRAGGRLERLDAIRLPDVASGGAQPEGADSAREAVPGKVQSVDRLVSLRDYETETLALPGVSRAAASWRLVDGVPAVVLTVLMDTGRAAEIDQIRDILASANRSRGPSRHPVVVHAGMRVYIYVDAEVALAAVFREHLVLAKAREALQVAGIEDDVTGTGDRCFGEREYATRIEGVIQAVEGVRWVRVTTLMSLGPSDDPTTLSVPSSAVRNASILPGPEEVLALHTNHLSLRPVAPPPGEGNS